MSIKHRWQVTGYTLTLMHRAFGWIELKDGAHAAGYLYFTNAPDDAPYFGAEHTAHPYIVMSFPISQWHTILDIVRHERPLFIRGFQSGADDAVSAFLETAVDQSAQAQPLPPFFTASALDERGITRSKD